MRQPDLSMMLAPKSVSVVGASPEVRTVGGMVLSFLLKFGYRGKIYPVNPKYEELLGIRCYPSIGDLPEAADTVVIGIPAKQVIQTIKDCVARGIKTAIIASAGFAEIGGEGKKLQEELHQIISPNGMRVCGPNCNGIVNFYEKVTLCFSSFLEADKIIPGNIGFVTQSGALGGSFINRAQDRNMGFTYYIAPGNEVDADVVDFMSFLVDDPNTQVIAAYIEQIRDGKKFLQVAEEAIKQKKPIVILKVGVTKSGAKAAASHTGALAGSDIVYEAAFKESGVIRVWDFDDLLATAMLLSKTKAPPGNRIGILSSSGGGSIILADQCEKHGLPLPSLSATTRQKLIEMLPPFATIDNPLDLTWGAFRGRPEAEQEMFKLFAQDENLDMIIFMMSMIAGERARVRASNMVAAAESVDKPFVTWWAAGNLAEVGLKMIDQSKITLFQSADRGIKAMRALFDYVHFKNKDWESGTKEKKIPAAVVDKAKVENFLSKKQGLTEHEAKLLLSCYDIPVCQEEIATSAQQAVQIGEKLGYPVALKISSPQIRHKSEAGGIKLNLTSKVQVEKAYGEILESCKRYNPQAHIDGVLIQEMVAGGVEVLIGVSRDPTFGPTIMFGLGGIFVEILKDFSLRLLPLGQREALEMIAEIKGYEILKGARGRPRVDMEALADLLLQVSMLSTDWAEFISEIDLNPVIVLGEGRGVKVVDALVVRAADKI